MKFKVYRFNENDISLQTNLIKKAFNFLINKNEDISIFSNLEIKDNMRHIVFHISDEHISGTKKGGIDTQIPFSQFINTFLINNKIFIEIVKENYINLIVDYFKSQYKLTAIETTLNNDVINTVLKNYAGIIKQVDISTFDGDIVDWDVISNELDMDQILGQYVIEFIAFEMKNNPESFVSLTNKGITGVSFKNEQDIISWLALLEEYID